MVCKYMYIVETKARKTRENGLFKLGLQSGMWPLFVMGKRRNRYFKLKVSSDFLKHRLIETFIMIDIFYFVHCEKMALLLT